MGKGGGGGSTPRLVDDNLKNKQFLNVIDLVSEGPVEGPVGGMQGFMLNGTPVVDKQGNPNIRGVEVQWKSGTQSQSPLDGFPFVEKEIPVNVEVKKETPILRAVSDQEVDRIRFTLGVSALVKQDDKGNQENTSVQMLVEINAGSGWMTEKEITIGPGKISGQYLESHIINAPKQKPFQIRVSRLTEDSKSDLLKNGTVWASYTEITDAKFSYPNSAVVGMRIDKSQYGDTPNRTYHIKGLIVQVPDNYDPETRSYNGIWTGRFKPAWTDNPAWIFYDLVTNERYGIGSMMGSFGCDRFALYAIARYCDEMVSDGFGGKEPRFTFNAYITSQRKAKDVIDDLASVFRGMPLWDGLQLTCFQDRAADPEWTYTNSNVIDGKFSYTSTAKSARHNAIEVSWINPDNGWQEEREFIQDDGLIIRLGGLNVKKVTAFGCTSRGQAHRVGKWILETEKLETESVTFSTFREGINCLPGDIIEVADDSFAGSKVGGRVLDVVGSRVKTDAPIKWSSGDKGYFAYLGGSGKFIRTEISSVDGDIVILKSEPAGLQKFGVFSVSKNTLITRMFRVLTITEDKDGNYQFNCILHEPQKERIVDDGVDFTGNPSTQNTVRIPDIERLSVAYINDSSQVQARAMWATTTVNRNITYVVSVYKNDKVVLTGETSDLEYYFNGLAAGEYLVGVRGKDKNGMLGSESKVLMVIGAPAAPSFIRVESGFFEVKLIPHISAPHTLNTEFEFWFSGEQRITNINNIEQEAEFLGRAKVWSKGQLKPWHDYWFYVRSINEYGKSYFVEEKGQANNNTQEILDVVQKELEDSAIIEDLQSQADDNFEAIINNANNAYGQWNYWQRENGAMKAEIIEVRNYTVTETTALAEKLDAVKVTADDSFAMAQNSIRAQWDMAAGEASVVHDMKVRIRYNGEDYSAGMVIGAELKGGEVNTLIGFNAQQFAFYNPVNKSMDLFMYMKGGQVFIREAFLDEAWIKSLLVIDKLQSENYDAGKKGFLIDAKTGKAELNDTIIRGTLYATDGEFAGTVYAQRIIGDVVTAGIYPAASAGSIYGGGGDWTTVKSTLTYVGGMPYAIALVLPTIIVGVEQYQGYPLGKLQGTEVNIRIDGVAQSVAGFGDVRSAVIFISAGRRDVKIEVEYRVRHTGSVGVRLAYGVVLACKYNSASFK
ncbi:phage tail protein [Morganella morganii]|uniref:TipJ family phage tail tip protein n=1 Tax=Morganella morganii TaxID=582 RepID=UPI002FE52ABF